MSLINHSDKSNNRVGDYLFFVILLIGACTPDLEEMTQSDALPLQWVPEGAKTFNEQRHCGIEHKCYYQPWRCDVDVLDQFYDATIRDYVLRALDAEGVRLFEKEYEVTDFNFLAPMRDWTVIATPNVNWTAVGSDHPLVVFPDFAAESDPLTTPVICVTGKTYRIMYSFTGTGATTQVHFHLRNAGGVNITPTPAVITVPVGTTTGYIDVTVDEESVDITMIITTTLGLTPVLTVNYVNLYDTDLLNTNIIYSVSFNPQDEGICKKLVKFELWDVTELEPVRISRTDLMDFKNSNCIVAWDYTSGVDYDGLVYIMPEGEERPIFRLCTEGVFARPRTVTQEVVVELTNSTIGTAVAVKKQKLLRVQDAPDFFNTKVELMLAHGFLGSVTDDLYNRTWLREDKYERVIRDEKSLLEEGRVYLTDSNYLKRGAI